MEMEMKMTMKMSQRIKAASVIPPLQLSVSASTLTCEDDGMDSQDGASLGGGTKRTLMPELGGIRTGAHNGEELGGEEGSRRGFGRHVGQWSRRLLS